MDPVLRQQLERRITADVLDYESVTDETRRCGASLHEFRPVVITDSLELVRRLRARAGERAPFIVYIADLDEAAEREAGLMRRRR